MNESIRQILRFQQFRNKQDQNGGCCNKKKNACNIDIIIEITQCVYIYAFKMYQLSSNDIKQKLKPKTFLRSFKKFRGTFFVDNIIVQTEAVHYKNSKKIIIQQFLKLFYKPWKISVLILSNNHVFKKNAARKQKSGPVHGSQQLSDATWHFKCIKTKFYAKCSVETLYKSKEYSLKLLNYHKKFKRQSNDFQKKKHQ